MSAERMDLQQVRKAIDRGDKATGRRLLEQLLESNLHGEAAWLWMSTTMDDPEQERACLKKVLEINPNNERAQRRWFELQGTLSPPVRTSTMPASAQQASKPNQSERRKWKLPIVALVAAVLIVVCLILAVLFFA